MGRLATVFSDNEFESMPVHPSFANQRFQLQRALSSTIGTTSESGKLIL